jgi:hypothetical protein
MRIREGKKSVKIGAAQIESAFLADHLAAMPM